MKFVADEPIQTSITPSPSPYETLDAKLVIDHAQLPGVPAKGPLALQLHPERRDGEWGASLAQFRNIRIKELNGAK